MQISNFKLQIAGHRAVHNKFMQIVIIGAVGWLALSGCTLENTSESVDPSLTAADNAAAQRAEAVPEKVETFRFVLVADSHSDNDTLAQILEQAKADAPDFVIHLGDLTRVGGEEELETAKQTLNRSGLRYYVLPGDHDIVRAGGTEYFENVFGAPYESFTHGGWEFILIDNSDIDVSFDTVQADWLNTLSQTTTPKIALMHNPPEHTLFRAHTMEETDTGKTKSATLQTALVAANVKQVFAGEMHIFQQYVLSGGLPITLAGAAGTPTNPFSPQYVLVLVYNDASLSIEQKLLTLESK